MTIFRDEVQSQRSGSPVSFVMIVYWLLRGLTFAIAILLGVYIIAMAFVGIPFHATEGYTPQFQDRLFGAIGDLLLFVSIVIPHSWTERWPWLFLRIGMIVFAVAWILIVDVIAYQRGLSVMLFTPHGLIALVVGAALLATLVIHLNRRSHKANG